MPTTTEEKLIDIKFKLDMYYSLADSPESTLEKIEDVIKPKANLNENQQVVLEWLKNNAEWGTPTGLIHELTKRNSMAAERIITAHDQLTRLEQFQILSAFAEWGMKNDQED
ncbi:hypothetical protein [Enterococcus raffinosus]|uniref:Uncharacterized protein n=1 Tax=Enterococcus raffinosus TaxID=71452 RepID=A0AAW8TGH8_9ENTE|nr:hypothetical protein [Enterococcus raffinosus]MDT2525971.1 hypothetical protein [Enterococcus raffinosus]MDT2536463.1 hypothetical protein [Enterococcus raffinosus]MDT2546911.1 hypothetical protein [Enterococcus raffinosus]MDT2593251.1 hypothetical protein [Enterococcus raffinosus]